MTSYEFEVAAKNAVLKLIRSKKHPELSTPTIDQLELVWFAHELGNKKCTIWGPPMGRRYAEVTYNKEKDEMYVDMYVKIQKQTLPSSKFNFTATPSTKENNDANNDTEENK